MGSNYSLTQTKPKQNHVPNNKVKDEEAQDFVLAAQIVQQGVLPCVLHTAIELNLFTIIARSQGPLSASQIAAQFPTTTNADHNAALMVDRMLRLLADYSIVSCVTNNCEVERKYGVGRLFKFFVPNEEGDSLGPVLELFMDKVVHDSWMKLKDAVLQGGIPFNLAHGTHAFEYPNLDPRFNDVFNKAMSNYPKILIKKILQNYNGFEGIKNLVDVGGGRGHNLHLIIFQHPTLRGINFDLPHVIKSAPFCKGVEHFGGDMLQSVPEGDSIFMKWVLQVVSDEQCIKLLKNCHKAIPKTGKVIVVESIVGEEPENTVLKKAISQMDLYMMTKNPGGKERTFKEFMALAKASGFEGIRICCQVGYLWVMEFYKK